MKLTGFDISPESQLCLRGRIVLLRQLVDNDYEAWRTVRMRCRDWLVPWEPRPSGAIVPPDDWHNYRARLLTRQRESQQGTGYGFGIFLEDYFIGEITISSIQRGPFQSGYIGYWVDREFAGRGMAPEATCVAIQFAFEVLGLHRIEIAIVPRNLASRRVAEKLMLRNEGTAVRFLEINGVWEDHVRYAITAEEWAYLKQSMSQWFPDQ